MELIEKLRCPNCNREVPHFLVHTCEICKKRGCTYCCSFVPSATIDRPKTVWLCSNCLRARAKSGLQRRKIR